MTPETAPARRRTALGTRARPSLVLSIGRIVQKGDKSHPEKLDHFRAKDGAYTPKFVDVFGDKPTEIRIAIPDNDFGNVIDVRWKAYAGGAGGKPGYLKALGHTNYATAALNGDGDRLNGPETLDGWQENGQRVEVKITGPDDPLIGQFKMKVYTTFRFWIPEVLGVGAWAEIATTSETSTHNLFKVLTAMYRATGGQWTGMPLILYLIPARGRYLAKDGKMASSSYWALAVRSPLSITELIAEKHRLAELQGGGRPALPPISHDSLDRDEELAGLWNGPEDRLRRVVGELPPAPDEPVRTRDEPASFPAPDDATMNRIAALRAEVGDDTADTLLVGAFGVDTVDQLDAELAASYLAGLERIAPAEPVDGEVVPDTEPAPLPSTPIADDDDVEWPATPPVGDDAQQRLA